MKAVLISIHPKWCEKIFNGEKRIEVRKSRPKIEPPFEVLVYCSKGQELWGNGLQFWKGIDENEDLETVFKLEPNLSQMNGKVIGSFVCDKIISTCGWRLKGHTGRCAKRTKSEEEFPKNACLSIEEIVEYSGNENLEIYGWHITEPTLFEKPRGLGEFKRKIKVPWAWQENGKAIGYFYKWQPITRAPQSWFYYETIDEK